jgi:hypothetical protein
VLERYFQDQQAREQQDEPGPERSNSRIARP